MNHLRTSGRGLLLVPRVRTKQGEAAFQFYAPQIWNSLPEDVRQASTLTIVTFPSKRNSNQKVQTLVKPTNSREFSAGWHDNQPVNVLPASRPGVYHHGERT